MIKVGIIGSCVTRDAFEFTESDFDVKGSYFPRASLISLISEPIDTSTLEIKTDQQWIKWVLTNDYNKSSISQLKQKSPQVICIDLIEERYDLISVGNSYLTKSDEFQKYNSITSNISDAQTIKRGSDIAEELFFDKALHFCKRINETFPDALIIIHEAQYCNYYRENGQLKKFSEKKCYINSLTNSRLNAYYTLLKENIKNSISINIDDQLCISCKHHKWGLSPFHYIDEYYAEFMRRLDFEIAGKLENH